MGSIQKIKEKLKNAGITELLVYSRKSRDEDDGEGLKKHHDVLSDFTNELGYSAKFYEEVGSSETLNRPILKKLREEIDQSRSQTCVVVYRLDRLSRKVTDTERLLREWAFNDVILIEAHTKQIIDYSERLGIKLQAMMSDLYQEQAKLVLESGRRKAVELYGHHIGPSPHGYKYNDQTKKLEVDQDNAWAIKKIFDLYLEGFSTRQIADKMNELGMKTQTKRGNGVLIASTIHRILQNEKYKGWQVYGKSAYYKDEHGKTKSKPRPESEWIIFEDAHEAIISPEQFDQVQEAMIAQQKKPHAARKRTYPLTALVKCGKCGRRMTYVSGNDSKTDRIRACSKYDHITKERCGNRGLSASIIEEYIQKQISSVIKPALLIASRNDAKQIKSKLNHMKSDSFDLKEKKKERINIEKQINNTVDTLAELGKNDRMIAKLKQLEVKLEIVEKEIEQLEITNPNDTLKWVEIFIKRSKDLIMLPNYNSKTSEEKNMFYSKYIDHVEILDREIIGIEFTKDVDRLISLTSSEKL